MLVCLLPMKINPQQLVYLVNPTTIVPTTPPWPRKLVPHEFFANQKHEN